MLFILKMQKKTLRRWMEAKPNSHERQSIKFLEIRYQFLRVAMGSR